MQKEKKILFLFIKLYIEINDITGMVLYKREKNRKKSININISDRPKGIYLVRIILGDKVFIEKILYQ